MNQETTETEMLEAPEAGTVQAEAGGFAALGLSAAALQGVAAAGFEAPTPIQERAIPVMMAGSDLVAQAQTGTGKTAAFALPLIVALARKYLKDPQRVTIEAAQRTVSLTRQTYYEVMPAHKVDALARILDMETPGSTIVFCRTRREVDELGEALRARGYTAESLHGEMSQPERDRVMRRFREGQADLLSATDVAARGLDIEK